MPTKNDHSASIPAEALAQAQKLGALLRPYIAPLTPAERRAEPAYAG
ncbi:MAG: hypothetical protein LBE06_10945 [Azoarcus sp.]|jgi:hypothetical protein|nr:hypothetical protein [Azoarcus sp.]